MSTNVPVTTWQGNGEYTNTGVNSIADTTSQLLVDTAGIQIVDTGVTFTGIPPTIWAEDDSL